MADPCVDVLLLEAPVNRHFALLHADARTLTHAVTEYVQTGLQRGNGVVVIASHALTDLLLTRLREEEVDPGVHLKSGRLELHNAELTLRRFTRKDTPDWKDFRWTMSAISERVRAVGRGSARPCVGSAQLGGG